MSERGDARRDCDDRPNYRAGAPFFNKDLLRSAELK